MNCTKLTRVSYEITNINGCIFGSLVFFLEFYPSNDDILFLWFISDEHE